MVNSYTLDSFCQEGQKNKFHLCYSKLVKTFISFALLIFAGVVSAQTIGTSKLSCDISNRNPCTSNDLQIVGVAIDAPPCTTCTDGQTVTYPLKMTIHNGTSLYGLRLHFTVR